MFTRCFDYDPINWSIDDHHHQSLLRNYKYLLVRASSPSSLFKSVDYFSVFLFFFFVFLALLRVLMSVRCAGLKAGGLLFFGLVSLSLLGLPVVCFLPWRRNMWETKKEKLALALWLRNLIIASVAVFQDLLILRCLHALLLLQLAFDWESLDFSVIVVRRKTLLNASITDFHLRRSPFSRLLYLAFFLSPLENLQ